VSARNIGDRGGVKGRKGRGGEDKDKKWERITRKRKGVKG
jgi:hypothetical protein